MRDVTFVFENGTTYAIHQGKVLAASTDADEVERQVKQAFGDPHGDYLEHGGGGGDPDVGYEGGYGPSAARPSCPNCGSPDAGTPFCPECGEQLAGGAMPAPGAPEGQEMGNPYPHDEPSPGIEMGGEAGPYMAKVITPNGLNGTVLGKVAGTWGEEVTVRLENGRIVHLPVGTELRTEKTAAAPRSNPIERLEQRLAATPDGTRESLEARSNELDQITRHASNLIREGASYADSLRLDQVAVTAEVEKGEVQDALAHLAAAEPVQPRSWSMGVAHEAAGISREDASWLDHTYEQMVKEAEATDFGKLMDEGPEALVAELGDSALADTEVTREAAANFIGEKTAGVARDIADPYMATFLTRVEGCRQAELANRTTSTTPNTHKEAAAEDKYQDLPDDALFL